MAPQITNKEEATTKGTIFPENELKNNLNTEDDSILKILNK